MGKMRKYFQCYRCKKIIIKFQKYPACKNCLKDLDQILEDKLKELEKRNGKTEN